MVLFFTEIDPKFIPQDRPNVFAALLQTQRRLGRDQFPLIEQHFFPSPTEMVSSSLEPFIR